MHSSWENAIFISLEVSKQRVTLSPVPHLHYYASNISDKSCKSSWNRSFSPYFAPVRVLGFAPPGCLLHVIISTFSNRSASLQGIQANLLQALGEKADDEVITRMSRRWLTLHWKIWEKHHVLLVKLGYIIYYKWKQSESHTTPYNNPNLCCFSLNE